MDIDDSYTVPHATPQTHTIEGDHDTMMMEEDGFTATQLKQAWGGTTTSKWAAATPGPRGFSRERQEEPAYLNNDPTLTAPRRPYRPQHVSYKDYY